MKGQRAARFVLNCFAPIFQTDIKECDEIGKTIPIPTFDPQIVVAVAEAAQKILEKMPIVLDLTTPYYIIGDIHGNIFDLIRILIHVRLPPKTRLLFLGDYVDRGEYSVEVITLLFSLLVCFPDNIVLLRGNHEFEAINSVYGFSAEINSNMPDMGVYETCIFAFQYMPLVAILNGKIFCVHGGISPHLRELDHIRKIKRPLPSYDTDYVSDLVWSDPCYDMKAFEESTRGLGVHFGAKALDDFLKTMNVEVLIRAHQCIQSGISTFSDEKLYTVFSCSNYAESRGNRCGLLFINTSSQIQMFSLPPIEQIKRNNVRMQYYEFNEEAGDMYVGESLTINLTAQELDLIKIQSGRSYSGPKNPRRLNQQTLLSRAGSSSRLQCSATPMPVKAGMQPRVVRPRCTSHAPTVPMSSLLVG